MSLSLSTMVQQMPVIVVVDGNKSNLIISTTGGIKWSRNSNPGVFVCSLYHQLYPPVL